jgi:putative membrane protein
VKPPRTRVSAAFNGFVAGAIVLMLLLIFILENTRSVKITFLGASGHLALGIALLLAAVGGALVVGVLGTARITQVRRHAKRHG